MIVIIIKKIVILATAFCLPSFFLFGQVSDSRCTNTIKVGFNDWPPYAWLDNVGKVVGLDVDMLTLVAKDLGCELEFIRMPVKRAHQMLKTGTLDMMMGASYTQDRTLYADFSDTYRNEEVRLFVRAEQASHVTIEQWQDIFSKKLKLLAPGYGWYGQDYLATKPELLRQELLIISPNSKQSVQMLVYGRGDVLIGDAISLPYIAAQSAGLSITPLPLVVDSNHIHFMISKKTTHSDLVKEVNQSILNLSTRGAFARVVQKWQHVSVANTRTLPSASQKVDDTNGAMNLSSHSILSR